MTAAAWTKSLQPADLERGICTPFEPAEPMIDQTNQNVARALEVAERFQTLPDSIEDELQSLCRSSAELQHWSTLLNFLDASRLRLARRGQMESTLTLRCLLQRVINAAHGLAGEIDLALIAEEQELRTVSDAPVPFPPIEQGDDSADDIRNFRPGFWEAVKDFARRSFAAARR